MSDNLNILEKLKNRMEYVAGIILATTIIAFVVSIAQVPEYETRSRLLVIQKQENIEAFSASKSADYIASLLEEAIYSDSFYRMVAEKDDSVSIQFSDKIQERQKEWENAIQTTIVNDKGILVLKTYDDNRLNSQHLGEVIVNTLTENAAAYHGGGDNVSLRVIDVPTTSLRPVRPNLFANTLAGVAIGIALSILFLLIDPKKPERENVSYHLHEESEKPRDINFLRDGHVAHAPSEHVISESFEPQISKSQPVTEKEEGPEPKSESEPNTEPIVPQSDEKNANNLIQNWMKNR